MLIYLAYFELFLVGYVSLAISCHTLKWHGILFCSHPYSNQVIAALIHILIKGSLHRFTHGTIISAVVACAKLYYDLILSSRITITGMFKSWSVKWIPLEAYTWYIIYVSDILICCRKSCCNGLLLGRSQNGTIISAIILIYRGYYFQ